MRCPRCNSIRVFCAWFIATKRNLYRCGSCGWSFIR